MKQAEAESAKIKLKYTQQEAALLKQKAESEANLQVLSQQKAFEADAAEVKVLQEHDVEGSALMGQKVMLHQTLNSNCKLCLL